MGAYLYYCAKVQPHLQGLLQQWDETFATLRQIPDEKEAAIAILEVEATAAKTSYNETKSRISTYIRMATGGEEYEPAASGRMATVDFAALRQLSSRESPSPNGHQLQLYDEACAQYRYIISQVQSVDSRLRQSTADTVKRFSDEQKELESKLERIEQRYLQYFSSSDFIEFIDLLVSDNEAVVDGTNVTIGYAKTPMPITATAACFLEEKWANLFDADTRSVNIPYQCDLDDGGVYIVNCDSSCEDMAISGIQNLVINSVQNDLITKVYLFDPVRYNDEMLGILSPLAGSKGSPVARVPLSDAEIAKSIAAMREEIIRWENDLSHTEPLRLNCILLLNQFPQEYNSETIKCIRFLSVNAKRNGLTIFLLNSATDSIRSATNELSYISSKAVTINGKLGSFTISDGATVGYSWPSEQAVLSPELARRYEQETEQIDFNNVYESRIGLSSHIPHKGNRVLSDIPLGVDLNGNISTIHFEDEMFGTFVCGAAGSGKTTMLHTIINGLLCCHPDDIELWLIDFKKVEFAQYINHRPPHVRYILLENSPEIVFDIVDELTKKLNNRKRIFMDNGWTKLADVPASRAMPIVFVIIDEFSEMSSILASSVSLSGNGEDYREKFKLLFSEGRSFGFKFILSCQAFSEGTRGLSDFAKMQIQQRIVMKTQNKSEAKSTLDISGISDDDQDLIENLTPHYAIQRMPIDTRGNRLKMVHVLYNADEAARFAWIDQMNHLFSPVRRYIAQDDTVYGDKLPVVIDGNSYLSYHQAADDICKYILEESKRAYDNQTQLVIGTPLRMKQVDTIRLTRDFRENVLLVSPHNRMMMTSSIIYSIAASASEQGVDGPIEVELWGMEYDPFIVHARECSPQNLQVYSGLSRVKERLSEIHKAILEGKMQPRVIIVAGLDGLLRNADRVKNCDSLTPETPDYLGIRNRNKANVQSESTETAFSFDTMIRTLLSKGPLDGCHSVLIVSSSTAYSQCQLPDVCRHKILYRTSARDASTLMIPAAQAICYANLTDNQYRYTNGLDRNTYRPYFHPGLTWDNLTMDFDGNIHPVEEISDDDYLV